MDRIKHKSDATINPRGTRQHFGKRERGLKTAELDEGVCNNEHGSREHQCRGWIKWKKKIIKPGGKWKCNGEKGRVIELAVKENNQYIWYMVVIGLWGGTLNNNSKHPPMVCHFERKKCVKINLRGTQQLFGKRAGAATVVGR